MKTIKDFTPEIQAKIPQYIEKYTKGVFDGGSHNSFNYDDAEKLVHWNYEQCKLKNPVVLVAENPYESQLFFNYIKNHRQDEMWARYIQHLNDHNNFTPYEVISSKINK